MTNEQFQNAVNEVKNLLTETNSEWKYDSSDAMDGYVFITICRPQTQEEKIECTKTKTKERKHVCV